MAKNERRERGTGSIFKRGNGYVAQVLDGYRDDGSPRYRQIRTKNQDDAVKALNDANSKLSQGLPLLEGKSPRLGVWLDMWLEEYIKPNREPKTYDFYKLHIEKRLKPNLGRIDIRRLRPVDVTQMMRVIEEDGASKITISATRRTLRAALTVAMKNGLCGDNPVTKTFAPKIQRKRKVYFDAEQVQALLAALAGSSVENLVRFTMATGVRVGEATGITWENVNLDKQTVLIENQLQRIGKKLELKPLKTEKSIRTMPLVGHSLEAIQNEKLRHAIEGYVNPLGIVFLNPWGRPFDPKFVNARLHEALTAANLPITGMHSLRHSVATFMLMSGLNMHQVSRYLGHSQIALTSNLYGHVLDKSMRDAAEALQTSYLGVTPSESSGSEPEVR
ncbi:MAG: site-specific integrase [Armatimonadetes bacterium]|nr:site-specific integrase [Armatimonadota bacterium]